MYLQLAVVQAGHRTILHFHLPELPDEQPTLWSCCSAARMGQIRAAADSQRGSAELAALTHTFVPLNVWGNSQLNWEPRELLRYAYNLKNIDKTENFRRTAQRPLLRRALPLNHAAQVNR